MKNLWGAAAFTILFVVLFVVPGMMWDHFLSGYLWQIRPLGTSEGFLSYTSGVLTRITAGGLTVAGFVWQVSWCLTAIKSSHCPNCGLKSYHTCKLD